MGITVKILLGLGGVLAIMLVLCAYALPNRYEYRRGAIKHVPYRYGAPALKP